MPLVEDWSVIYEKDRKGARSAGLDLRGEIGCEICLW